MSDGSLVFPEPAARKVHQPPYRVSFCLWRHLRQDQSPQKLGAGGGAPTAQADWEPVSLQASPRSSSLDGPPLRRGR